PVRLLARAVPPRLPSTDRPDASASPPPGAPRTTSPPHPPAPHRSAPASPAPLGPSAPRGAPSAPAPAGSAARAPHGWGASLRPARAPRRREPRELGRPVHRGRVGLPAGVGPAFDEAGAAEPGGAEIRVDAIDGLEHLEGGTVEERVAVVDAPAEGGARRRQG